MVRRVSSRQEPRAPQLRLVPAATRASKHPVPAVTRRPAHPPRREPCAVLPLTRPAMRPRFATVPPLRVPPTRPRSRSGLLALESAGIVDWGKFGQRGPFRCSNRDLSCTSLTDSILHGNGWSNPPRGGAHAAADGTCSLGDYWQRNGSSYDPAAKKFTAAHCDGGGTGNMVCFSGTNCSAGWYSLQRSYALAGFPCGDIGPDGIYESVCDGGAGHNRHGHLATDFQDGVMYDGSNQPQWYPSKCVPTSSLLCPPRRLLPHRRAAAVPAPVRPPAPFATTTLFRRRHKF